MEPRLVTQEAFRVVGLEGFFTPAKIPEIPALWGRFGPRIGGIAGRQGTECYGLCQGEVPGPDGTPTLWYMAASRVAPGTPAPEGLTARTVPAGTYAVFTHEGHVSAIGGTFDAIFHEWLPAAGLVPLPAPGWERYDERWDPRSGTGPVDIYVPVERAPRGATPRRGR
jgi:AraC family transcriptional regulator